MLCIHCDFGDSTSLGAVSLNTLLRRRASSSALRWACWLRLNSSRKPCASLLDSCICASASALRRRSFSMRALVASCALSTSARCCMPWPNMHRNASSSERRSPISARSSSTLSTSAALATPREASAGFLQEELDVEESARGGTGAPLPTVPLPAPRPEGASRSEDLEFHALQPSRPPWACFALGVPTVLDGDRGSQVPPPPLPWVRPSVASGE